MTVPPDYLAAIQERASGTLTLDVVMIGQVRGLAARAEAGDERAALLVTGVVGMGESVMAATPAEPAVCGCCSRRISDSDVRACAIVMPFAPEVLGEMLAFAICDRCGPTHAAAERAAIAAVVRPPGRIRR